MQFFCYNTMISRNNSQHRAQYDENGNIILPFEEVIPKKEVVEHVAASKKPARTSRPLLPSKTECGAVVKKLWSKLTSHGKNIVHETKNQYKVSAVEAKTSAEKVQRGTQTACGSLWAFLTQPVWILKPNKKAREG